jgi:NAD(P)-dependent dehydrogenase (short-subunit alcohol dehydrogenase family)
MENYANLDGRVAIVTGAAQGIGARYAMALARRGAKVVIADILDGKKIVADIRQSGGEALAVTTDVTRADSVANMVSETLGAFGKIDILVNNAALFGNLKHCRFEDIPEDEWDAVMRVNITGLWQVSRAVVPEMRKLTYGKIINIASTTALKGTPMLLHYVSSKGAVIAMSRAMAREVGDDNICVNTIAPGLTLSENVVNNGYWPDEWVEKNVSSRAIKRVAVPEDIVGTMIFLASPESDFITGQVIVVDGGAVTH